MGGRAGIRTDPPSSGVLLISDLSPPPPSTFLLVCFPCAKHSKELNFYKGYKTNNRKTSVLSQLYHNQFASTGALQSYRVLTTSSVQWVQPQLPSGLLPETKPRAAKSVPSDPRTVRGQRVFLPDVRLSQPSMLPWANSPTHHAPLQGVTS